MSRFRSKFAALDFDSDSEPETPPPPPPQSFKPLPEVDNSILWGDLLFPSVEPIPAGFIDPHKKVKKSAPVPVTEKSCSANAKILDLLNLPFASKLEMHTGSVFDMRGMSDSDWNTLMSWVYAHGWHVDSGNREWMSAWPESHSPKEWPLGLSTPLDWCVISGVLIQRVEKIARFCSYGDHCRNPHICAYIHEDTMPVLKKPCTFGLTCGKRTGKSPCAYLHPDEVWSPTLVRHRPSPQLSSIEEE